ncbi:MAG: SRPBCC domain-containing protein [Sphingomonas sp.]
MRFVELAPPVRIVEAIRFVSDDPEFHGEMTMTALFEQRATGTEVVLLFENLPIGLRPEDNEEGARLSLEQLAWRCEA